MTGNWLQPNSYRTIQLKKIATESGLSYTFKDEFGTLNLLKDFRLFELGGDKRLLNVLRDKSGLFESDIQVFDYQYAMYYDEDAEWFSQTVFFTQSKNLMLPPFSIRSSQFFNAIGNYLGIGDIDVGVPPLFSDQFTGKEEGTWPIYKSLSKKMLQFFADNKDWNVEGLNYYMIFYKKNTVLPRTEILNFLEKGKQIVEMLTKLKK